MSSTISLAIERPSPVPDLCEPPLPRKKRSKTRWSSSCGIPGPSSATVITTSSSPAPASAVETDGHRPALGRELDGVVEQRPQHLAHAALVAGGRQLGRRVTSMLDVAALGARPELGDDGPRQGRHVDVAGLEAHRAGVDLREVEQAEREVGQPVDLLAHQRQELLLGLGVELALVDQLHEARQREQRRLELVRGGGDEVAAGGVEPGLLGDVAQHDDVVHLGLAADLVHGGLERAARRTRRRRCGPRRRPASRRAPRRRRAAAASASDTPGRQRPAAAVWRRPGWRRRASPSAVTPITPSARS